MKRILSVAALIIGILPMAAQDIAYKITGTVPDSISQVYLHIGWQREPANSAITAAGRFEMSGTAAANDLLVLYLGNDNVIAFNDGTPIAVNTADGTFEASPLNKKLNECNAGVKKYDIGMARIRDEYEAVSGNTSEAAQARMKELEDEFVKLAEDKNAAMTRIIEANKDNIIPAVYISQLYYELDYHALKALLPESAPYYNHPLTARPKKHLAGLERRLPGKMFTDLTMNDTEGTPRSLSE